MDPTTDLGLVRSTNNEVIAALGLQRLLRGINDIPVIEDSRLNTAIANACNEIYDGPQRLIIIGQYHDKDPKVEKSIVYVFKDDKNEYIYYVRFYTSGKCGYRKERMVNKVF